MQVADTDFGPYRPMKGGPDVMSEDDAKFMRGTKQRVSLPVVRSANQSKEKTLGVLYLQYGGETRQTVMPNAVTTLDTVRALFVKAFPDVLSMSALEAPDAAFLLRDSASSATPFRLLADLREIKNKATLKVAFRAPVNRQPQALNGGDTWEESARRIHGTSHRHGSHSGSGTPTVPQSPAQHHYSLQQRQQQQSQQHYHHHQQPQAPSHSGAAAGFISGMQGPSAFSPAAAFFGAPSPSPSLTSVASATAPLGSILERRDVRPDEDLRNRDVLLVRSDAGALHYPQMLVGGGRYSLAASGPTVVSSYSTGDRGGRSGPWDDSTLRSYTGSSSRRLGSEGSGGVGGGYGGGGGYYQLHHQQQQQQQRARSRTPPASLHALQASLAPRTVVPISIDEPDFGGHRRAPAWAVATTQPEQPRRVSIGSSEAGATTPFRPIVHADDRETRERMESMERQIASLTELLHRSVTREEAASLGVAPPARAGASAAPVGGAPRAMRGRDEARRSAARATAARLQGGIAQLRAELREIRRSQLSQRAAWQSTLASVRQEISTRLASEAARAARDEPARRLRAQAEEERQAYMEKQHAAQHRLSELEEAVETLRSRSSLPGVVSLTDVDEGEELLRQLEEEISVLRGQFPGMQSRMRGLLRVEVEAMKFLKDEPHKLDDLHRGCRDLATALVLLRRSIVGGTPVDELEKPSTDEPEPGLEQVVQCDAYVPHFTSSHRSVLSQQQQQQEEMQQQQQREREKREQQERERQREKQEQERQREKQKQEQERQREKEELERQREKEELERQREKEELLRQQQEQQKLLQQQQEQKLRQQHEERKLLQQQQEQQLRQQHEEQKLLQQQQEQQKLLQQQAVTPSTEVTTFTEVVDQSRAVEVTTTVVSRSEEVTRTEVRSSEAIWAGVCGMEEDSARSDLQKVPAASASHESGGGGPRTGRATVSANAEPSVETIALYSAQAPDVTERSGEGTGARASAEADAGGRDGGAGVAGEKKPAATEARKVPEKRDTANRHVTFARDLEALSLESGAKEAGRTAMGGLPRSSPPRAPAPAERPEEAAIPPPPTMSPPPPPPRGGKGFKFVRTTPAEVIFMSRKASKVAVDTRADQSEEDARTPPPSGSGSKPGDNGQTSHMTIEVQGGASSVKDTAAGGLPARKQSPGQSKDPRDCKNIGAKTMDTEGDPQQSAAAFEEEVTDFSSGRQLGPGAGNKSDQAGGLRRGQVVFQEKDIVDSRAQAPKTITIRYIEEITSESTDEDGELSPGTVKEKLAFLIRESRVQAVTHDEAALIAGDDGVTTFTFTSKPQDSDDEAESPGRGDGGGGGVGDDVSGRAAAGDSNGGTGGGGGGGDQDSQGETGGDAGCGEVTLRDKKPLIVIFDEPMDIRSAYKRLSTIFEEKDLEEDQEDETEDDDDDDYDDEDSSSFEFNEREAARAAAEEPHGPTGSPPPGPPPDATGKPVEASRETPAEPHAAPAPGGSATARPSVELSELQAPGKDGGGKSKFKIKFPRKQLAALTSALRSGTRSGKKTLELVLDGDEASDGDGDSALASMNPYAQVDGSGGAFRAHAEPDGADVWRSGPENGASGGRAEASSPGPDGPDDGAHGAESGRAAVATDSEQANGKSAPALAQAELTSQPSTPKQGQKAMRVLHSITSSVRQASKSGGGGGGGGGGGAGPPATSPQRKHKS